MNLKKYVYSTVGNTDKYIQSLVIQLQNLLNTPFSQKKTRSAAHTTTPYSSATTSRIKPSINSTISNSPYTLRKRLQSSGATASPVLVRLQNSRQHIQRATSLKRLQAISAIRTILKSTKKEKFTR